MPIPQISLRVPSARLEAGFDRIRAELKVPDHFPPAVLDEAEAAALRPPSRPDRIDRTDLDLVTIDPAGSRDLDQAFGSERRRDGYRIWYAIADVAAFVEPGRAIDAEALARGVTLYAPDRRASLHPERLAEGAASLLPDGDRPALLWRLDIDEAGELVDVDVERSRVRTRAALSYEEAQTEIDRSEHESSLTLLREIGERRLAVEAARGGVSLNLPTQEVVADADDYRLQFDRTLPIERWNAQVSLLTGIAAAQLMVEAKVGIVRTLPPPSSEVLDELRTTADALDIAWPAGTSYADVVRGLEPDTAASAAFLAHAVRALRGAGYLAFDGMVPEHRDHWAIASDYAHVTAPLRRVVDRFANEIVLALVGDQPIPDWVRAQMNDLPALMGQARSRESALDRAVVDYTEAVVLESQVGRTFEAVLTTADERGAAIQLRHPPVLARLDDAGGREPGTRLSVVLAEVDVDARRVKFEPA